MKVQNQFNFYQLVAILFMFFYSLNIISNAQSSFNLDDPNIIWKDKDGNLMTIDSVKSFVNGGNFAMMKRDIGGEKKEIWLMRQNKEDLEKMSTDRKEWANLWTGKSFPNFELLSSSGKPYKRLDLNGKVTVVNFWFTGCAPCVTEMPKLNELVGSFDGQPVNFIAFSYHDKETIEKFLLSHKFQYTHLVNAQNVLKELNLNVYPTHMVLDKKGFIREIIIGGEGIDKKLNTIIEELKVE